MTGTECSVCGRPCHHDVERESQLCDPCALSEALREFREADMAAFVERVNAPMQAVMHV